MYRRLHLHPSGLNLHGVSVAKEDVLIKFFMYYVSRSPEVASYLYELWLCIILQMVKTSANLLQCVFKCLYQFYDNYLNSGSLLGIAVLRILPDQGMELQALNLNFILYKVMERHKIFLWRTMVADNGVLSQIPTKLPGIKDLSKLKVSAPVI